MEPSSRGRRRRKDLGVCGAWQSLGWRGDSGHADLNLLVIGADGALWDERYLKRGPIYP